MAIDDVAREGRLLPGLLGIRIDGDDVLVRHQDDRIQGGIAPWPGVEQRVVRDEFACEGRVYAGVCALQVAPEVPEGLVIPVLRVLARDRGELERAA